MSIFLQLPFFGKHIFVCVLYVVCVAIYAGGLNTHWNLQWE